MTGLHPKARQLIDAANRGEAPPPEEALLRVRRSVLRRAAIAGGVMTATGTAGGTTKAGLLGAGIGMKLLSSVMIGAVAGIALVATRSAWLAPERNAKSNEPAPAIVTAKADAGRESKSEVVAEPRPVLEAPVSPASNESARREQPLDSRAPLQPRIAQVPNERRQRRTDENPPGVPTDVPSQQEAPQVSSGDSWLATNLAREVEVLRQVHAALGQSRPQEALDLLHRNEDIVQGGSLQQEAQAARISALCQLGRDADARIAMDGFLVRWPQSLFATRIRGGCHDLIGRDTR
jgi:hypothetical protein